MGYQIVLTNFYKTAYFHSLLLAMWQKTGQNSNFRFQEHPEPLISQHLWDPIFLIELNFANRSCLYLLYEWKSFPAMFLKPYQNKRLIKSVGIQKYWKAKCFAGIYSRNVAFRVCEIFLLGKFLL